MRFGRILPVLRHVPPSGALLLAAATAAAAGRPPAGPAADSLIRVQHARFWRGGSTTLLEGLAVVATRPGLQPGTTRTMALVIRDANGAELLREEWQDTIRVATDVAVTRVSPFAVALQPGAYRLAVHLADAVGRDSAVIPIEAFGEMPPASDLILSRSARVLDEGEAAGTGEVQKGRYALGYEPLVRLTPAEPGLWYYLELYPGGSAAARADVEFVVLGAGPEPVVQTVRAVEVGTRGHADAARLDLAGLPPGSYRLEARVRTDGTAAVRSAAFSMAGFEPVVAAAPEPGTPAAEERLLARYFAPAVISDSAINVLVDAITLATPGPTAPGYVREMEPEAKRRFLARYWARLDARPDTPEHELLEEYIGRVEQANRRFGERQIGRPGIRTDRGRIYLRYGPPDMTQSLPMSRNRGVEMWRYTRQRNLKFVFFDETGFDNYILLTSTDPAEPGLPDWADRLGERELVQQVQRF
jgi:GWxTD domain-containing protein